MKKHNVLNAVFLSTVFALSGCAVGPDYQAPSTIMEDTYMYAETSTPLPESTHWWERFNDPVLDQLVWDAQHQNISLKMASERIQMAKNYHKAIESYKLPTLSIGASYYHYQISENTPLLGDLVSPIAVPPALQPSLGSSLSLGDDQQHGFTLGATIGWELDLFGRINHQTEAAKIRAEQSVIFQKSLYTLITAEVVHNYLQLRGTQERKAVLLDAIADQKKILDLVDKVVKNGLGSDLDRAQAQAMLAVNESMLPQLEVAEQVHKHRLSILLAESLQAVDARVEKEQPLNRIGGMIPTGLPSDLLTRRFDIALAEREMAALNEEVGAAVANQYPKFFLTGTPGLSAGSFSDLFSGNSFGWVGSAGIKWNVFDAGRGKAIAAFNEARFKSAALGYQNKVDSAFKEVDSLLFAYGRSKENQQKIDDATQMTDKAVSKAQSLYQAGLIDSLSVLDAQRQLNAMRDRQVAAKLQTAQVMVSLYKALGGDWIVDPVE